MEERCAAKFLNPAIFIMVLPMAKGGGVQATSKQAWLGVSSMDSMDMEAGCQQDADVSGSPQNGWCSNV